MLYAPQTLQLALPRIAVTGEQPRCGCVRRASRIRRARLVSQEAAREIQANSSDERSRITQADELSQAISMMKTEVESTVVETESAQLLHHVRNTDITVTDMYGVQLMHPTYISCRLMIHIQSTSIEYTE